MKSRRHWFERALEVFLVGLTLLFGLALVYTLHLMVTAPDFTTKDLILILGSQPHY